MENKTPQICPTETELEHMYSELGYYIESKIPGFAIVKKSESKLMKFLSKLLFFNKGFMTDFITTIYPKVYVPDEWALYSKASQIEILAHEYRHLRDRKVWKVLFNIGYLFPQILVLLAFLAFVSPWFLLSLVFILPLPSTRAISEYRGYCMSMAVEYWLSGKKMNVEYVIDNYFASGNYYWMFPFRSILRKAFNKFFVNLETFRLPDDVIAVYRVLNRASDRKLEKIT